MGRRRRGRRPWEGQPGQPRFGPEGSPSGGPARGTGNTASGGVGPSRWRASGDAPRRPYEGGHGQWQNGRRVDHTRTSRWSLDGGPASQYAQTQRFATETRAQRFAGQAHAQRFANEARGQRFTGDGRPPRFANANPNARSNRFAGDQRHQHPRRPGPREDQPRPTAPRTASGATIDPFELFCAYHLGITTDGSYRIQNVHEVARRFGTNAGALKQTLAAYGMEADDIVHSGFDLASAQIDIMVAPEGVSRRELARPLYEEFKSVPRRTRDWARELEEAERQIERTIGRDGRWSPGPRDPSGKQ
jgi:hypothetical protein